MSILNYLKGGYKCHDWDCAHHKGGGDDAMLAESKVKRKLAERRRVGQKEGYLIEEMVGEIQALEFVLEERKDL